MAAAMRKVDFYKDDATLEKLLAGVKVDMDGILRSFAEVEPALEDAPSKAALLQGIRAFKDTNLMGVQREILRYAAIRAAAGDLAAHGASSDDYAAELAARTKAVTDAQVRAHPEYKKWKADLDAAVKDAMGGADDVVASVGGADLAARVKCQITRKRMVDPVRNGLCSHVYDRAGIMLLNRPGRPWLCPIAGCKKPIKDLTADAETRFFLDELARLKAENGEPDSEAEGAGEEEEDDDDD